MNAYVLTTAVVATLALSAAPAAAQCSAAGTTTAASMPCCADHDRASAACCAGHDHATPAAAVSSSAVQTTRVTFRDPVRVGDKILLGRYVIEHDNDRMARGEPCTFIYAADDRRLPVVMFRCTHLTRPVASTARVVLRRSPAGDPVRELREFQFAGEEASHGVPAIR